MRQWHEMSPEEQVAHAVACVAKRATNRLKYPLSVMAAAIGTTAETLKQTADPEYAAARRATAAVGMRGLRAEREEEERTGATRDEYEARRREIPPDTRSGAASWLGDPIPGDTRRERYGNEYQARSYRGDTGTIGSSHTGEAWFA